MHYVKQAIIPFVYLFFVSIIALGIFMIPENLQWLRIILLVLNVGLYGLVACATAYKDGQDALKVRIANDLERMEIIRTGEDRPLKIKQEYAPWKGFLTGGIVCAPLIILLIVHSILVPTTGATGAGATGIGITGRSSGSMPTVRLILCAISSERSALSRLFLL